MRYLNDGHIEALGTDWEKLTDAVREAALLYGTAEAAQPLKPYLRFRDPANRIIAMPAFVGGSIDACGLKWVASYPGNYARGLPRAHSTIVLNDPATGEPVAVYAGGRLNALRTAAVSGALLAAWLRRRGEPDGLRAGIVGFGPIGQAHLAMLDALYGDRLAEVRVHDARGADLSGAPAYAKAVGDWREAYEDADVFVTATTSTARYIDRTPRPGSLLLNVSLRDYEPDSVKGVRAVVVDDWREVCREDTDIERMHRLHRWTEDRAATLKEALGGDGLARWAAEEPVFFNPMGMAVFDIAIAASYWRTAVREGIGVEL